MKAFMDKDFMLQSPTAQHLYHDYAADMPICDYHCHIPPRSFAATIASVAAAPPSVAEAAAGGTPSAASATVAALSSIDVPTPYANAATSPWSY